MNHRYLVREIILKYHRGEVLTAEEQAILDDEMANLPADKVWERIRSHIEKTDHGAVIRPWYTRWSLVTAGAAAVVGIIAVGVYRYAGQGGHAGGAMRNLSMQMIAPGHYRAEVAGPDGVMVLDSAGGGQDVPYPVALPDGSTVTLCYQSSVRYAKSFVKRSVALMGQAYFKIAKKEVPFAVTAGNRVVEVLGTEFNWMHYAGIPDEITLYNGGVVVELGEFKRELKPAERMVITAGPVARVRVEKMRSPEESNAWMNPQPELKFDSTDLVTVIQRLAQYHQVGFTIDPALQSGYPVTGTMYLNWTVQQNTERMDEILKGIARVRFVNGIIEVTKIVS
jgi:hypothetical protein